MGNRRSIATAAVLLVGGTHVAIAGDVPSLVGTWKARATAVHIGHSPYRFAEKHGPIFGETEIEFVYTISEQKGQHFAGELHAAGKSEVVIGSIQPDNTGGVMLDNDGQYIFTLRGADMIDTCYTHLTLSSKLAACFTLVREK